MLNFIFSTLHQLRFDQCKNILEKLEKVENLFYEEISMNTHTPKKISRSPSQGSSTINMIKVPQTPQSLTATPMASSTNRSHTQITLGTMIPPLFNNSILSATPKVRPDISLAMRQAVINSKEREKANWF